MPVVLLKSDADRARARGIEASRKPRPLNGAVLLVYKSIQGGRKTREQIGRAVAVDDCIVGAALARLRRDGLVVIVGKAEDIGAVSYRRNAPVYDVAGAPLLAERPAAQPKKAEPRNVAGRTYYPQLGGWGQWR
jgi:hypothetical protein